MLTRINKRIPEDDLLESDSSVSSECELSFMQDRLGISWQSGLVSGTSSRRVVINDTPQPLRPGDRKHRAIYSSGHNQHSSPRSILRTPNIKTKSHVTHSVSNKKEKSRQVDILRVHSNTSSSKVDFPTRKTIENPFPISINTKHTMETIPQHDGETKLVSFLKQLLKEFKNLVECLGSTKEELSQTKIDQTSISTLHDSLSESLGNLNILVNNKILAEEEEVDYPSVAETLNLIISYLIMAAQSISEQYWKLQEEVHSVGQEKRWLQQGKQSLLQEQQELHHVLEISKAQLLSEKNELRLKQESVAAAKLELLKQCNTPDNHQLTDRTQKSQRITKLPAISNMKSSERSQAKHILEMNSLREANKTAKAELAVAQDNVPELQKQMEKQYQESQKKTKDLTRRLRQAEDTMKLAAGAMGNNRRRYPEMLKPNYKRQHSVQKTKPQDIQYGKYKKQQHHRTSKHESEQLWERASKFVQETGQNCKPLPYQTELNNVTKTSKRTTTIHTYNKPSTVSQVAKWLTHQHT